MPWVRYFGPLAVSMTFQLGLKLNESMMIIVANGQSECQLLGVLQGSLRSTRLHGMGSYKEDGPADLSDRVPVTTIAG